MRLWIAILGSAVLSALAPPAGAATPPDSVASGLVDATCPVAAVDPVTHTTHIAYVDNGTLHHAWQSGGDWLDEAVAGAAWTPGLPFDGADLRVGPDGVVWVLHRDGTHLVCARRVGGTPPGTRSVPDSWLRAGPRMGVRQGYAVHPSCGQGWLTVRAGGERIGARRRSS